MNIEPKKSVLNIKILGKEYKLGCLPELENSLRQSAQYLDLKMRSIRDQHHVVGLDRTAVLAALHITHELLNSHTEQNKSDENIKSRLQQLTDKISSAINSNQTDHTTIEETSTADTEEFSYSD